MRIKQIKLILAVLLSLTLMTGCWDAMDIEDKKIATLVIVDKLEDEYSLFLEFVEPGDGSSKGSGQEKSKSNFVYQKAAGNTLAQAREALEAKTKQIYLGAVSAVLITENLAKEGIAEYVHRLRDINDYRKVVDIIITRESPEAFETVEAGTDGVGATIEKILESLKEIGEPYNNSDLGDILEALADPHGCFMLPTVGIENKDLKIIGLSIFDGEILKGFIPWQAYDGIRFLHGQKPECYCVVPLDNNIEATIQTKLTKKKLIPTFSENMIGFQVEMSFDAQVAYVSDRAKLREEDFQKLKDEFEQQLKREIEETIRVSQQDFQCDYLGFYKLFRIKYPVEFKQMNWEEVFPQASFSVKVTVNLDESGAIDFLPQYDFRSDKP